jgi:hypothetical protein
MVWLVELEEMAIHSSAVVMLGPYNDNMLSSGG